MTMPLDADSELTDDALLALYASGNRAAARMLTLRLTPRVLSLAARMLGDRSEAEDVAQEAMLRLWKIAPDWRSGEAQVSTWLYRVASNLCTDRLRRRRGVGLDDAFGEGVEPADEQPGVETRLQEADRLAALKSALADLPERQRTAVVLRHLEGLSNPEIAVVMEIGVEAVESLTARGKRALAARLKGQRAELGLSDDG
ncbi:RNA polymerase sigma factor [Tropicimonas sp. TH_r6]|uniref:RNA polymerase sigma factor n=1 Tax=Tropicimonas sp. TH_r6 TaxID=3082085 RepID=UPI002954ABDC|nr:RNA polymerase sigma factor [Tropicimonas sp. TH_r6]MDV7144230.1 RNA polymerase sigma factor [Tropicimonas sp. TH_r6]